MSKKALVLLAPGSEEMEVVIVVDVLRRAGVNVILAGLEDKKCVKCSRGVMISPDTDLNEAMDEVPFDALVIPGGNLGATALSKSIEVGELLQAQEKAGRIIAAICSGPTVLKAHGIGTGRNLTSYPSLQSDLMSTSSYTYKPENVVVDDNLITSRAPGTSFIFALTIADKLVGSEKAKEVAKSMLVDY